MASLQWQSITRIESIVCVCPLRWRWSECWCNRWHCYCCANCDWHSHWSGASQTESVVGQEAHIPVVPDHDPPWTLVQWLPEHPEHPEHPDLPDNTEHPDHPEHWEPTQQHSNSNHCESQHHWSYHHNTCTFHICRVPPLQRQVEHSQLTLLVD